MKNKITKDMVENGLKLKLIRPVLDGELKCYIGDYWFWFGGAEYEYTDPKEIPFDTLVNEIFEALNSFADTEDFEDEYNYYYYFLFEKIFEKK